MLSKIQNKNIRFSYNNAINSAIGWVWIALNQKNLEAVLAAWESFANRHGDGETLDGVYTEDFSTLCERVKKYASNVLYNASVGEEEETGQTPPDANCYDYQNEVEEDNDGVLLTWHGTWTKGRFFEAYILRDRITLVWDSGTGRSSSFLDIQGIMANVPFEEVDDWSQTETFLDRGDEVGSGFLQAMGFLQEHKVFLEDTYEGRIRQSEDSGFVYNGSFFKAASDPIFPKLNKVLRTYAMALRQPLLDCVIGERLNANRVNLEPEFDISSEEFAVDCQSEGLDIENPIIQGYIEYFKKVQFSRQRQAIQSAISELVHDAKSVRVSLEGNNLVIKHCYYGEGLPIEELQIGETLLALNERSQEYYVTDGKYNCGGVSVENVQKELIQPPPTQDLNEIIELLKSEPQEVKAEEVGFYSGGTPASVPSETAALYSTENCNLELLTTYREFCTWGGGSQGYKWIREKGQKGWQDYEEMWALRLALMEKGIPTRKGFHDSDILAFIEGVWRYVAYKSEDIPVAGGVEDRQDYEVFTMEVRCIRTDHAWWEQGRNTETVVVAVSKDEIKFRSRFAQVAA